MRRKAVLFFWLCAFSAWAQQVVVLEFQGDVGGRLGKQMEDALWEYESLKPMPRQAFMREALKAGSAEIKTAAGFARAASHVKEVSIAVWGRVGGGSVEIFIWDKAGHQLWSRHLPLEGGLLTQALSQRLAKAIVVAVHVQNEDEAAPPEKETQPLKPQVASPKKAGEPKQGAIAEIPSLDFSASEELHPPPPPPQQQQPPPSSSLSSTPPPAASPSPSRARFLRVHLLGNVSWHSLCARPGVDSCGAFDRMPLPRPTGTTMGFSSGAYGGMSLQVEYFPLALHTLSAWKGLGLRLEGGFGQATKDFVSEADILLPQRTVQEFHWSAEVLYRYFFLEPSSNGIGLHASLSIGYAGKDFLNKGLPPPNVRRRSMEMGLDAELALLSYLRLGCYANIFIQPKPGDSIARAYGEASSFGYRLGGTLSGKIYGPLSYRLEVAWNAYKDTFSSASREWPACNESQCGGVVQETYLSLRGGLQLEF
ncbi:MAG: hypothetical protein FWD46_02175 [Cystobacterineae bacterium]|nr:hypothetical protein [Cystobacterineae bacterium]